MAERDRHLRKSAGRVTFWLFVVSTAAIVAGLLCASLRYGTLAFEAEMGGAGQRWT
ncbi:hypothetical protein [Georgenia sp. AZ-5]|uniref:hypothetical protein n=1 Tax=Georgenia sp. AZ-5 TaxID=3367526 RepID=UPI003754904C